MTGWTAASQRSSSAPAWCASSSSLRTSGSTTGRSTNSAMSGTLSAGRRTARWSTRSPTGRSARCSRGCRPSPPSRVGRTSSCQASTLCATWRRSTVKRNTMTTLPPARTYNQNHIPRPHNGQRRISIYWTWSYPWEAKRDPAAMYNRFSTMTEVGNALWPSYETPEYDAANFLQGIAGTLELFHRSALAFQELAGEATGHPVAVFQRIDQAGYKLPIDERILADTDTLMVFGLDHILSEQEAAAEEISAIRDWLQREGTCLLLAPHHDVGFTSDLKQRQMEYLHHGDALVPRQQRFGQFTRSLMKGLDVPVHNTYGLCPALVKGTKEIAPLTAFRDIDKLGLLNNVPTLNFHPHLPHY